MRLRHQIPTSHPRGEIAGSGAGYALDSYARYQCPAQPDVSAIPEAMHPASRIRKHLRLQGYCRMTERGTDCELLQSTNRRGKARAMAGQGC